MRRTRLCLVVLAALLVAIGACAPKVAPTLAPPPVAPQATPIAPSAPTPTLSPEDIAWAKVVEAAKREGKVTLYTWQFVGDTGKSVAKAFEGKYGIKVEFVTGIGTVLIERIKGEHAGSKYIADTLDSAVSLVAMAKQDGLTDKVGELPVLREKDVWTMGLPVVDPQGHIVALRPSIYSTYVNTTLVRPGEEPKSLLELLEPKWKGKVTLDSPVTSPAIIWVYLSYRKAGLLDDEYWRRLAKNEPKIGPSVREPLSWISRGEAHVLFSMSDGAMAPFVKEGAPVKPVEPQEGIIAVPAAVGLSLLKNAPHPNAARVFINWTISQEGQTVYAQALGGFAPRRKDVTDVRPAVLKLIPQKLNLVDLPLQLEATQVQRQGTLAKLMGLEK